MTGWCGGKGGTAVAWSLSLSHRGRDRERARRRFRMWPSANALRPFGYLRTCGSACWLLRSAVGAPVDLFLSELESVGGRAASRPPRRTRSGARRARCRSAPRGGPRAAQPEFRALGIPIPLVCKNIRTAAAAGRAACRPSLRARLRPSLYKPREFVRSRRPRARRRARRGRQTINYYLADSDALRLYTSALSNTALRSVLTHTH